MQKSVSKKKKNSKKRKKKSLFTLQVWGFDFPLLFLLNFFFLPLLNFPPEKFLHDSCHTWKSKKKKKAFSSSPSAFIALGFCSLRL